MHRLGYTRYVAQGGDVGALVVDLMGLPGSQGFGRLPHEPAARFGARSRRCAPGRGSDAANAQLPTRAYRGCSGRSDGFGYFLDDGNAAADDGYALAGFTCRPGGLAARSRHGQLLQIAGRLRSTGHERHGQPDTGQHPRQHHALLADRHRGLGGPVVLGDARAAASLRRARRLRGHLRSAFTVVPRRESRRPRSWVEPVYPDLAYFNEAAKGGHFAAWEEPQLFSDELRAAFRPLR